MACALTHNAEFLVWLSPTGKDPYRFLKVSIPDPNLPRVGGKRKRLPPQENYMEYNRATLSIKFVVNITTFSGPTENGGAPVTPLSPATNGHSYFYHLVSEGG